MAFFSLFHSRIPRGFPSTSRHGMMLSWVVGRPVVEDIRRFNSPAGELETNVPPNDVVKSRWKLPFKSPPRVFG